MDNELSNGMTLTIVLVVVSAVVGVVLVIAGIGQVFQRSLVTTVTDVVASAYGTEITALEEHQGQLPVATVYLVAERNRDFIDEIRLRELSGATTQDRVIATKISWDGIEELKKHFSKKYRVIVDETAAERFIITVDTVGG